MTYDYYSNDVQTAAHLAYEDGRDWDDERPEDEEARFTGPARRANPFLDEYDEQLRQARDAVRRQESGR